MAWGDLSFTTSGTYDALRDRVTGQSNAPQLTSVVGIVQQSSDAVHAGVYPRMLALISLSLALFNMLPFLPLDGGHVLFTLIEAVRRRPLRREVYERVSMIGLVAMLTLFLFALHNDVSNIANGQQFSR
jgi:regulator of sigma E protease